MSYEPRKFKEGDLLLLISPDKKSYTPVMFMKYDSSSVSFECEELGSEICEVFDPEESNIITVYARRLARPEHNENV